MLVDCFLVLTFLEVVAPYIGGNPQDCAEVWTSLRPKEIQKKLSSKGLEVSYYIACCLISHAGLKRRSYVKNKTMVASHPLRNAQFEKIADLKSTFIEQGCPVLSIDTKKKELIGNFARQGHYYDTDPRVVNDHDFESFAQGKIVPHGIYDIAKNKGYITLGSSKDTSAFVCDNIEQFWEQELKHQYANKDTILIVCDGGGSNNARHYIVKEDLYKLAKKIKMNIRIAHYPPYCSKYNPIEHRLFAHLHHAWEGCTLNSIEIAKELAKNTKTKKGLEVKVNINQKEYETKRKVQKQFKQNLNKIIEFDEQIPQWNYIIKYQNDDVIF